MAVAPVAPIILDADDPRPSPSSPSARLFQAPNDSGRFPTGSIAKLVGLSSSPDMNGRFARIGQFDEEKQRYEVWMIPGGDRKGLRAINLEPLSVSEEVTVLGERLNAPGATAGVVRIILSRLDDLHLPNETLWETKIGKVVNDVGKRFHNQTDIVSASRRLVFGWRDQFRQGQAEAQEQERLERERRQREEEEQQQQQQQQQQTEEQRTPRPLARSSASSGSPPPTEESSPGPSDTDVAERELKRPRVSFAEETVITMSVEEAVSNDMETDVPTNASPTVSQELQAMADPYAQYLHGQPALREFLMKHPHVMQNLCPDNIAFLTRNIKRSASSDQFMDEAEEAIGRTVRIVNLPPDVGEPELQALFRSYGVGKPELAIPRESRSRRTVGVGSATFKTKSAAEKAIPLICQIDVSGRRLWAEWLGGPPGRSQEDHGRRITWKTDDELWEVALFDRFETVLSFSEHLQHPEAPEEEPTTPTAIVSDYTLEDVEARDMEFQKATEREHAEEASSVRQALAG